MPASHPFNPLPPAAPGRGLQRGRRANRYRLRTVLRHVWQGGADAPGAQRLDRPGGRVGAPAPARRRRHPRQGAAARQHREALARAACSACRPSWWTARCSGALTPAHAARLPAGRPWFEAGMGRRCKRGARPAGLNGGGAPAPASAHPTMPNAFNFTASPFDCLSPDEQRLVRDSVDIAYFPEGETVVLDVGQRCPRTCSSSSRAMCTQTRRRRGAGHLRAGRLLRRPRPGGRARQQPLRRRRGGGGLPAGPRGGQRTDRAQRHLRRAAVFRPGPQAQRAGAARTTSTSCSR